MNGLLVAGTTSDAGKTIVTTAICRAFARRGVKVAPFKSQNMSNNSMVVRVAPGGGAGPWAADGYGEIGRAQWIQAVAAGAEPEAAMNPVLLKPGSDHTSHVVVMGKPAGTLGARSFTGGGRAHLAEAAFAALDDLASRYDVVVAEGRARRPRSTCARTTTSTWASRGTPGCPPWWSATSTAAVCSRRCSARSHCSRLPTRT